MNTSIIGACAVRVSRLDSDGTPDFNNAVGAFVLCGGISKFEHGFEHEEGADIFQEDACGNACVIRKRPDRTKRATFTLTMCKDDYRLSEILGVATALGPAPNPTGRAVQAAQGCGSVSFGNGVSIELWSEQWDCDAQAAGTAAFMRAVLVRAHLRPAGFTRENGVALPVYEGFAVTNPNYGDGPFGDLDELVGIENLLYAEVDDDALPTCPSPLAYVPTPAGTS